MVYKQAYKTYNYKHFHMKYGKNMHTQATMHKYLQLYKSNA